MNPYIQIALIIILTFVSIFKTLTAKMDMDKVLFTFMVYTITMYLVLAANMIIMRRPI